jgi:ABC-type antimicrobial peptide transport system permease subunit
MIVGHTFATPSGAEATMLVSQSAAAEFWPGENPIGKKLSLDASDQFHDSVQLFPQGLVYQVIGVVGDTRAITPQGDEVRKVYLPFTADRFDGGVPLLIRFTGDAKVALREIAKQLQAVDPNVIVYASTLEDQLTSTPRFVITQLSAIFASLVGLLGLVLACVGIYGTVSYAVVRRTREVGIRMALGARKKDVLQMIVFESARPVMLGLIVGAFAAAGAARLLRSLLFGIGALDPVSFLGVGLLFLAISLFAAYLPARRAAHVDPLVALRCD